ncbi:MAG: sporulation protein YqfD [Tissierellaceae bacterium]|jgi:similar to stage IV sporulation protein|nr:sporulation protein YqfD [Tissierellia bacterium]
MLAIKIWNYIRGYVIIRIRGLTLERLLNLALSKDIYLWNVNRLSNTRIEATVSLSGLEALEAIVNKSGCEIEIIGKTGLPFILNRLKYKKMFALGVAVFISLILFLSSLLWKIEIIGIEQIPKDKLVNLLKDNDIRVGIFKHRIDKKKVEKIILSEYDFLSFLDVQISGIKLIVDIKELDIEPDRVDKSYPCNLVAKKKGVIVKIVAKNGEAVVEKGQIVEENDILISGTMKSESSDERYLVHAEGEVLAQTRYSHIIELPIVKLEEVETGRVYKQRGLTINDKGVRFLSGNIPFENYTEEVIEKDIIDFKWLKLDFPVKFVTYLFREVEIKEIKQEIEYLKAYSKLEATKEINKQLSETCEIISRNEIYTIDENILRTQVTIETIEDIGRKQIISN